MFSKNKAPNGQPIRNDFERLFWKIVFENQPNWIWSGLILNKSPPTQPLHCVADKIQRDPLMGSNKENNNSKFEFQTRLENWENYLQSLKNSLRWWNFEKLPQNRPICDLLSSKDSFGSHKSVLKCKHLNCGDHSVVLKTMSRPHPTNGHKYEPTPFISKSAQKNGSGKNMTISGKTYFASEMIWSEYFPSA